MNYDMARQRADSRLWDWTSKNDDEIHRAQPCTDDCAHLTAEDAEKHFYDYCLSQASRTNYLMYQPCEICGALTNILFGNSQLHLAINPRALCPEHATMENLKAISPFIPGLQLAHS